MPITKGGNSGAGSFATHPLAVAAPIGVINGDVLITSVMSVNGAPTTVPGGWTQLQQTSVGSPNVLWLTTYRKVASGEGSSYTWDVAAGGSFAVVIKAYRGVDNTTPVSSSSANSSVGNTVLAGTALTTTSANQMIVWCGAFGNDFPAPTISAPTAMVREVQADTMPAGPFVDWGVCLADAILASIGTTDTTFNNGSQPHSVLNVVHMIALSAASTTPQAITSNAQAKFGATSGKGFGYVKRVGTEISLGAGDFTVEGWVYWVPNGGTQVLFDWGGSGAGTTPKVSVNNSGNVLWISVGATQLTTSNAITANVWTHVAVVRKSGTLTIYIGGVSGGTFATAVTYSTTTQFAIGRDYLASTGDWAGYIDETRASVTTAFYSANFAPPTGPFPGSVLVGPSLGYVEQLTNSKIIVH